MAGNEHAPHPEMRRHGEDTCPRCPGADFETLEEKNSFEGIGMKGNMLSGTSDLPWPQPDQSISANPSLPGF